MFILAIKFLNCWAACYLVWACSQLYELFLNSASLIEYQGKLLVMLLEGQFLIEKYFVLMDELFKKIRCWFIFFDTIQREIYTKVIQILGYTSIFYVLCHEANLIIPTKTAHSIHSNTKTFTIISVTRKWHKAVVIYLL